MEEKVKEEKYFHYENIGKNIWTTLIGSLLMAISGGLVLASQIIELPLLKIWWMVGVFTAGFALLFMRDKLPSFIESYTKKKIG